MTPSAPPATPPTAIITGASSGIGRAIAIALSAKGYMCTLVSRYADLLARTARLTATTSRILVVDFCDVALTDQVTAELAGMPTVNLLVHCAGVHALGPIARTPVSEVDRLYAVNFRGAYQLTQALLPKLAESRGQIVFMNSSAAIRPAPGLSAYAASKAALNAYTSVLRDEVNPLGIRVINVFPGRTASPMQKAIYEAEGRVYKPENLLQPEDVAATVISAIELPRTAEVTDIHIRPMMKG